MSGGLFAFPGTSRKGRDMQTSYFANLKKIKATPSLAHLDLVSIARGSPPWFKGRKEMRLAPTRDMLDMQRDDYLPLFDAILANLDAQQIAKDLGENAVLFCWEKPGQFCHRRIFAEWIEKATGLVIPELGFERADCPSVKYLIAHG